LDLWRTLKREWKMQSKESYIATRNKRSRSAASIAMLVGTAIAIGLFCLTLAIAQARSPSLSSSKIAADAMPPTTAKAPLPKPRPSSEVTKERLATGQEAVPPNTKPRLAPAVPARDRRPNIQPRAVERQVAGRITIADGMLVLPVVAYYGRPVILDVPKLGYVELSEQRYARIYTKLTSNRPEQVDEAMGMLRVIKETEDAEVAARLRGPVNDTADIADSPDGFYPGDLSVPIKLRARSRID
jgi:hypothetical protein